MNWLDLSAAVSFIALSAFVTVQSAVLGIWTPLGPGPGFFPLVLGVALAGLAVMLGLEALRATARQAATMALSGPHAMDVAEAAGAESPQSRWVRSRSMVLLLVSLVATLTLMDELGFRLSTFIFVLFLLVVVERRPPLRSCITAALISVGCFYLFSGLLSVQLPVNPLGM